MADGRIRRHGRNRHSYEQRDGGWWDRGDPVSHENLLRYFGKNQLIQNEKGAWDYNHPRDKGLTTEQRKDRMDYEIDYDKFPYNRKGERFVRDPNTPLTKFEQIEKEFGDDDFFGGKGFWEPIQNNPYLPKNRSSGWGALQEAIERSGEINRGPGFKRENYGFGGGEPWNSPHPFERRGPAMYDPSIKINPNDFLRKGPAMHNPNNQINPSDYITPYKSNRLNQLSPSGIDNFNSRGWNSGMKDWR